MSSHEIEHECVDRMLAFLREKELRSKASELPVHGGETVRGGWIVRWVEGFQNWRPLIV